MAIDVHSGGVFLRVNSVLDAFKGNKTKASGFFSLLIVDKLAALEFSVTLENSAEFFISGSSTKIENT